MFGRTSLRETIGTRNLKKEKTQVSSFGNICMYSLAGENDIDLGGAEERRKKRRWRARLRSMESKMEDKRKKRFGEDDTERLQGGLILQPPSRLIHLCMCVCVLPCIYANACSEIIQCGMSCPRSVETQLSFHRYESPG